MDNYVKPEIMPLTYSSGGSPYVLAAGFAWLPIFAAAIVFVVAAAWWAGIAQVQVGAHFHLWAWSKVWLDSGE